MKRITIEDSSAAFWPADRHAENRLIEKSPHTVARALRLLLRDRNLVTTDEVAHDLLVFLEQQSGGRPAPVTVEAT